MNVLLTEPEALDQLLVPGAVDAGEVLQEAVTSADELEQPATRRVVLLVRLEVLGQLADALAQDRDLHFRAAGVRLMGAELADNLGLLCVCQHGNALLLLLYALDIT